MHYSKCYALHITKYDLNIENFCWKNTFVSDNITVILLALQINGWPPLNNHYNTIFRSVSHYYLASRFKVSVKLNIKTWMCICSIKHLLKTLQNTFSFEETLVSSYNKTHTHTRAHTQTPETSSLLLLKLLGQITLLKGLNV